MSTGKWDENPRLVFLYESYSYKLPFPHANICCKVNRDSILWRNIKSFCVESGNVPQGLCISTDSLRFALCTHLSLYWSHGWTKTNQDTYTCLLCQFHIAMTFVPINIAVKGLSFPIFPEERERYKNIHAHLYQKAHSGSVSFSFFFPAVLLWILWRCSELR